MDKSLRSRYGAVSNNPSQAVSIGRRVLNAIRKLQGNKGISLHDLKKYLQKEKGIDLGMYNADINLALKSAVDKGLLIRESGNYKIREARRRRSRSKGRRSRCSHSRCSHSRRSSGRKRSRSRRKRSGSRRRRSRRRKAAAEEA